MAVPNNPLTCYKGEDFTPPFQVDPSVVSDITGWTIVFTCKVNYADVGSPLLTVSGAVTDGPNRKFNIPITALQLGSTGLATGTYNYDIWRTDSGAHWVLSVGTLTVLAESRVQVP